MLDGFSWHLIIYPCENQQYRFYLHQRHISISIYMRCIECEGVYWNAIFMIGWKCVGLNVTLIQTFQVRNVIKLIWHYLLLYTYIYVDNMPTDAVFFVWLVFFIFANFVFFFGQVVRSSFFGSCTHVTVIIAIVVCFSLSLFYRLFNEEETPLMSFNMLVSIILLK